MDLQKAANWSQVVAGILAAIALGYVVWDHLPVPTVDQSIGFGLGAVMRVYAVPAIITLILFASAILQAIAFRRRHLPPRTVSDTNTAKPTIEILSPFDNDEVGLYETIYGRVFPPDQDLQVVVFAGDKKWYPQKPVTVKGSSWSAKCQFGNIEGPSGGSYKVVALLGNELRGGMWYSELPIRITQSNIITVHRSEVTTEHELMTARRERDEYKRQVQSATNAFTDMEEQVETLTTEKTTLERELLILKKEKKDIELRFKAELEEEKKKTKPDIHGEIKEVWFEKEINLETSLIISQDCYFYYWFYLRVFVANYGAATTIDRYKLLLKSKGGIHEGQKVSLKGYSLRNAFNEHLIVDDLSDIEDQNDVALEHTRNGWLCFAVPSIMSNKDNGAIEDGQIEIQVIDKTKTQHHISSSVQAEWRENTQRNWPRIVPSRTNWSRQN